MKGAFLAFLVIFIGSAAAKKESKPVLSKDPLTAEQIAVYRAALENYTQGEDTALHIAIVTEPFGDSMSGDRSCLGDLGVQPEKATLVHRLDPAVALSPKMVLVDPDHQNKVVDKNDPGNAIHGAVKKGEPLSDKQVEESVKQAFSTGLFTFSEIVFDKDHTHAALWYSFHCGALCGHGNTIVLKKTNGKWSVAKVCGGWISWFSRCFEPIHSALLNVYWIGVRRARNPRRNKACLSLRQSWATRRNARLSYRQWISFFKLIHC